MEKSENEEPVIYTGIKINDKRLFCCKGDITDSNAGAIVNAANNHLWMGSGVAGAIKSRGGQSIEDEAIKLGPIEIGDAAATKAGKLKADYVIHAAVMGQDLTTNEKYIKQATCNCLKKAEILELESIDFPALGTGVGGFPLDQCAELMITEAFQFLENSKYLKKVGFVLFDDNSYQAFFTEIEKLIASSEHIGREFSRIDKPGR